MEAIETSVNGQQQYIVRTQQQIGAVAAKLTYLMGMNGGVLTPAETLEPINRVDTSVAVEVLVRQAQENGPGVHELQGLIASIQQSVAEATRARRCCCRTGESADLRPIANGSESIAAGPVVAGEYSALKLRAGVEDAFSAVVSGSEQIALASKAIDHAKETYRIMDLRESEESPDARMRNKTYDGVLNTIRQLSQAYSNYLTAVSDYNKAQVRLLILLGTYAANCPPQPAP